MGLIASIFGGIAGTLGALVAALFFDASWTSAVFIYFLTAFATVLSLVALCVFQSRVWSGYPVRKDAKSGFAVRS